MRVRVTPRTASEEERWQAVRDAVHARDAGLCQQCGQVAPREERHVHHLIPRAAGGRDEAGNCVTLCSACHAGKHPNLQVSLARRMMERWAVELALFLDRGRELPREVQALDAALQLFKVSGFRDGQLEIVLAALRGESMLVVRPTGSGKSLCFQLPAVLKGQPATVVLSPLRALMVDQVQGLHVRRLPATFINGDLSGAEKRARLELFERGHLTMLYLAPERFEERIGNQLELDTLSARPPSFLVVDEAHLVDRWGSGFRPQYGRIAEIRERLGNPPLLLLTATAGRATQDRILEAVGEPAARRFVAPADRPNITLLRLPEPDARTRARMVVGLLDRLVETGGKLMIFAPTIRLGMEIQELLAGMGRDLDCYHGKLERVEREQILQRFRGEQQPASVGIICTNALALGLDVKDVRVVVHWQHPAAVEDYLQEFGRAGREGQLAAAVLFTGSRQPETGLLKRLASKTAAEAVVEHGLDPEEVEEHKRREHRRIDELAELTQAPRCFRAGLLAVLEAEGPPRRRSAALRLLGVALSDRRRPPRAFGCCDHCDPELAQAVRRGTYTPGRKPLSAPVARGHQSPPSPPQPRFRGLRRRGAARARVTGRARATRRGGMAGRGGAPSRIRRAAHLAWRRRRVVGGLLVAAVALALLAPTLTSTVGPGGAEREARAVFMRHVRAQGISGEFETPRVRQEPRDEDIRRVCSRRTGGPRRLRRTSYCALIKPRAADGRRVVGTYRWRPSGETFACSGRARKLVSACAAI